MEISNGAAGAEDVHLQVAPAITSVNAGDAGHMAGDHGVPTILDQRRAMFCSSEAYKGRRSYPSEMGLQALGIKSVIMGKRSSKSMLLAIAVDDDGTGTRTLFVAFAGSQTPEDWLLDADIRHRRMSEAGLGAFGGCVQGRFHAGFHQKLVEIMPYIAEIQDFANRHGVHRLVFCGHSLGGALAHMAFIKFTVHSNLRVDKHFHHMSIGFGSPHFCDAQAQQYLYRSRIAARMFTYVAENDPVPRLLTSISTALRAAACRFALRHLCKLITCSNAAATAGEKNVSLSCCCCCCRSCARVFKIACPWIFPGMALPHYAVVGRFLKCDLTTDHEDPHYYLITPEELKANPVTRLDSENLPHHRVATYLRSMAQRPAQGDGLHAWKMERKTFVRPTVESATLLFKGTHDPLEEKQVYILVRGKELYLPFQCSVDVAGISTCATALLPSARKIRGLQWSIEVVSKSSWHTILLKLEDKLPGPDITNLFSGISSCSVRINTRFGKTQKYKFRVQPPCFDSYIESNLSSTVASLLVLNECGMQEAIPDKALTHLCHLLKYRDSSTPCSPSSESQGFTREEALSKLLKIAAADPTGDGLHSKLLRMKYKFVDPIITSITGATGIITYRGMLQLLLRCLSRYPTYRSDQAGQEEEKEDPLSMTLYDMENKIHEFLKKNKSEVDALLSCTNNDELPQFMRKLPRIVQRPILDRARMIHHVKRAKELIKGMNDVKIVMFVGPDYSGKSELIKCLQTEQDAAEQEARNRADHTFDAAKAHHVDTVQCFKMSGTTGADVQGGKAAALLRIPGRSLTEIEKSHTQWPDLERVPDLCIVVVSYAGDTREAAEKWSQHARRISRHTREPQMVMVVTGMDRVLHGESSSGVWNTYSRQVVQDDRQEYADVANIPVDSVYLAVTVDTEIMLDPDTKEKLSSRGVLFRPQIRKKLRSKILDMEKHHGTDHLN